MEWVKCSDRLPAMYEYVLVFADNKGTDEPKTYSIARYVKNGNYETWEFINHSGRDYSYGVYLDIEYVMSSDNVTHWMPLPIPPKDNIDGK